MKEYFSHDYNTRADDKIIDLLRKEKLEGYGIYWCIVEMIYTANGKLRQDYDLIAFELRTQCERIKAVVEDFGLFYVENNFICSESIDRRLAERENRAFTARSSAMKRWGDNAKAMPMQCKGNAIKESKEKKRKEKEREDTYSLTASAVVGVGNMVNWDNCKSDHQRLLAHYVMREMPELYKSATQAQANSLFKRYGRAASEVLGVSGDLPTAIRAFDLAMAHFNGKGLSWNLSTVSKNIGEFVNQAMNERRAPNGTR